ncbi:MAG: PAS domain-containing protein [Geobacteraceae bacterium]|nr:PAS domain-containing protein [Geobacteraceae bacterium]
MRIKFQWKLMASYLTLILLTGVILYGYLSRTLERHLTEEVRENLINEAKLVRLICTKEMTDVRRDAPAIARTAGKEIKARVTIIAADGRVAGDSELNDSELRTLENHATRPEFLQARKEGIGISSRFSSTLGTEMLYVAVPFRTAPMEDGVLRLALPLSRLDSAMGSIGAIIGAALLLAVAFAFLLSYVIAHITSRPLRDMAAAAALIGRGNFGCRIPVVSRDEIGELAAVMNEMTAKIEDQIEKMSAERNRLDTILRGMGEGVIVTDQEGNVTLANPAFRVLFSLGEEIEGKSLVEITRQPAIHNALKKVLDTREEIIEEMAVLVPHEKYMLTHWVPLREEGKLLGAVAVFHDITDLKRLENVRKDFVANVSHELRTPVSVIKGFAETLLFEGRDLTPEKNLQFITIIHNHAERLANLISDLLALSRMESGVMELEPTSVNLAGTVARTFHLLEGKALAKQVSLVASSSLADTPPVLADPSRLEQVLINLLDNAVKYTPAGGSVTVSATQENDHIRIDVADTGVGIPPQDLPRIFERFYRVDTARSRDMGGTGLGLSIVKHIVQAHGGTISVDSTPGKGSTFSFTMKRA